MTRRTLKQEIADVYAVASLPPEITDRLTRLGDFGCANLSPVSRRSRVAWYGLVASVVVLLAGNIYSLAQSRTPSPNQGLPPLETASARIPALTNLVVARIHADWCSRSPDMAPLFVELSQRFGNQPVLFVTLDITNDEGRKAARALAAELGIESVADQPFESGMMKLIDRSSNKTLAIVTDRADVPSMEGALASALPRR